MSNCGSQRSCQWWRGTRKKTKRKKELDEGVQQILWFTYDYETWYWKCLYHNPLLGSIVFIS
jgi:hypothetical protein